MGSYRIRMATTADAKQILEIYNPYIANTTVTFEYETLSVDSFMKRMQSIMKQFPYLVCECEDKIVAYAYCSSFHERAAFDWDCEASIYIDKKYHGMHIGTSLYNCLFDLIKSMGYYNVYALISIPNPSSIAFHERFGFELEGCHKNTGYKFGKWIDLALMRKTLADYTITPSKVKSIHNLSANYIEEVFAKWSCLQLPMEINP